MRKGYGSKTKLYSIYTDQGSLEATLGRKPAVYDALGDVSGLTVLEIGCGPGTNGPTLRERGARFIGLDISRKVIEEARWKDPLGDYRIYRGQLARIMEGVRVDAVLMSFSLCAIGDSEASYMLPDIRQLIRPNKGKLVVVDPNPEKGFGIQYEGIYYHPEEGIENGDPFLVTLGMGDDTFQVEDIYRTLKYACGMLEASGMDIELADEPMPDSSLQGDVWDLARKYPPFQRIVAR